MNISTAPTCGYIKIEITSNIWLMSLIFLFQLFSFYFGFTQYLFTIKLNKKKKHSEKSQLKHQKCFDLIF